MTTSLPIDVVLPELRRVLRERSSAVLQAPPGAGKTTRVPLALLEEPWLGGKKIVMLEPRRLAARMAAGWMTAQAQGRRGTEAQVGGLVGYRIRRDTKVSKDTRIEVVTEGVLTRILRSDPALEAYGCVIFDEFHERSLPGDLGLALTLQAQQLLRPELRILVMSATLDGAPIARLLGDAPVVSSEGRAFPVETKWIPRPKEQRVENAVVAAVRRALEEVPTGDILAFLPGAREIRSAAGMLASQLPTLDVFPLFGDLKQEEQDRAVRPSVAGRRKVVLAMSIAETSLTIDGVTVVVDGGMARVPKFSPRTGMTRLMTVRVSRASADQRRGRAGRVAPGVCYRCWDQNEERGLIPRGSPEIHEADLAPLALDLAVQGTRPDELPWLDAPPAAAYAQAVVLLQELGALDHDGRATPHGREIAEFGVHPRLAHMLLKAGENARTAADLAALLGERDILRGEGGPPDPDLTLRLEALAGRRVGMVDEGSLHRVRQESRALAEQLGLK
ncbi:MAG TPA: ATP-dependent helicase HrpB, partial [Gemmatimonadales bacterium]